MSENVLNMDEALERIGGDKEFLFELLNEFISQMERDLPALSKAVEAGDFENIGLIAHSLRGAAGNLSVTTIYRALSEIESLVNEKRNDKMAPILEEVYTQESELRRFLQGKQKS